MSELNELFKQAKEYVEHGFSVIPMIIVPESEYPPKGNKVPAVEHWKEFQDRKPTLEELKEWFTNPNFKALRNGRNKLGIAIITGKISGNLAVIDFDSRDVMSDFLGELSEKHPDLYGKLLDTWIVETGRGYHYYIKVIDPDHEAFRNKVGIRSGIDIRANGGLVVAPPSPHPSGKTYRTVNNDPSKIVELTWDEYLNLLSVLGLKEKKRSLKMEITNDNGKVLQKTQILEIVSLLKPIYKVGYRNYVILYLTGWLKKAGISYKSAREIVEHLAEDDEELNQRIYVLDRTYGLRGSPPTEEDLKGKTGLQEIAETLLGEEKALDLIRRLEESLGRSSPFKDSIFSLIDTSRKIYYVANPRRGIMAKVHVDGDKVVYGKIIAECCPTKVIIYEDPLGGVRKFEITFNGLLDKTIGPADLESIIARLQAEGVVKHSRLIRDALSSILMSYIRYNKAEIRREIEKPGFYLIDGQIKAIKWDTEDFTKEDLKKSLELLNELREKWYSHLGDRFTTVIKWGLIAPFSHAIKQIRRTISVHFPDLVLHGASHTGKTTLGHIIPSIWNPPEEARKVVSAGEVDTKAKHGRMRSLTSFPIVVNEVAGIFNNKDLLEDFKNAIENRFVRGKHIHGQYVEFPSLAPFFMTTNATLPLDDALRRRFKDILLSIGDRIDQNKAKEFERSVLPRLENLRYLGYFTFKKIAENPEVLKQDWKDIATQILKSAFEFTGLEVPKWVYEFHENNTFEEINEYINEIIRSRILENINNLYSKHIHRFSHDEDAEEYYSRSPLERRLRALLRESIIPWAILKDEHIVITTTVMELFKDLSIDSLKSLAERFGWRYGVTKICGKSIRGIKVPFKDFVEFLEVSTHDEEENSENIDDLGEWDLSK